MRFAKLPYIRELTPKLIRIFQGVNCKIASKSVLTVNNLFSKLKDKVPLLSLTNTVYSIPCSNCNLTYIGQTSRSLKGRLTSHKSDARLHPNKCALASHAFNLGHIIDYNSVKILARESNLAKRCFLEMTHIYQCDNSMNKKTDIHQLSDI